MLIVQLQWWSTWLLSWFWKDYAIIGQKWLVRRAIVVFASMAVSISFIEAASIAVDGVYHGTFVMCDDGRVLGASEVQ